MALVNLDTLREIKALRDTAISATSYDVSYRRALRGLTAAIAQLEQIHTITQNLVVEIKVKDS